MNVAKVLLVDDERDLAETMAKRLNRRGYQTLCVFSGREALALLANEQVDVVVLDVRMPGMDGIETLAAIKKLSPDMEAVLLTGHVPGESRPQAPATEGIDILLKPVEMHDLLKAIDKALERRRLRLECENPVHAVKEGAQ